MGERDAVRDKVDNRSEKLLACRLYRTMEFSFQIDREHDAKLLWRIPRELDVRDGGISQAPRRLPILADRRAQAFGKPNESFFGDGGQELILVAKMAEGCGVGDSDAPRYFTEREFVESVLAHQIQRGAKQRSAKIAMVVRLVDRHF